MLIDSLNWTKISGSFIADSAYNCLVIGNFITDENTDTLIVGQNFDYSYYYIDDICLSIDSSYCVNWTNTHNQIDRTDHLEYFPNPCNDIITINSKEIIHDVSIYNMQGKLVFKSESKTSNFLQLDLSKLNAGIYMINIVGESTSKGNIFIKN